MRCTEARELFSLYLDNGLSPVQEEMLRQHLSSCGSCAHELAEWLWYSKALKAMGAVEASPPPGFRHRLLARLEEKGLLSESGRARRSERLWRPIAASVAVAVLAIGTWLTPSLVRGPSPTAPVLIAHSDQGILDADRRFVDRPPPGVIDPDLPGGDGDTGLQIASPDPAPGTTSDKSAVTGSGEGQVTFLSDHKTTVNALLSLDVESIPAALDGLRLLTDGKQAQIAEYRVNVFPDGTAKYLVRVTMPQSDFETLWSAIPALGTTVASRVEKQDLSTSYLETLSSMAELERQRQSLAGSASDPKAIAALDNEIAALGKRVKEIETAADEATIVLWLRGRE